MSIIFLLDNDDEVRSGLNLAKTKYVDSSFARMGHYRAMQNEDGISQHTGRSLFTRDFILVFLAFFVFIAANHALIPTLPIYLAKLGSNERQVGVLVGVMAIAALVSRFFVGGVLTKYSEKVPCSLVLCSLHLPSLRPLYFPIFGPFLP